MILKPVNVPSRIGFLSYVGDTMGCGFIRVIFPYTLLNQFKYPRIRLDANYIPYFTKDVNFYKNYSFIQFQRSCTKQHLMIHEYFRKKIQPIVNVPLIYEIDDLLTDIPEWNYAHPYYKNNIPYIEKMLSMSDGIVVSTPKLKEVYSKYNKNIEIIPNHLPKFILGDIWPKHENNPREKKPIILWTGSQNHFALKHMKGVKGGDFGKDLMKFIRKTTDKYRWTFIGGMPLELQDIKNKVDFHPFQTIFQYYTLLKDIEPDICVAPLEDNLFNACKSNIKMIEFSAIGTVGIYSNVEPYKNAYLKGNTDEELINHIEETAKDIDLRAKAWKKDFENIRSQIFWEENDNLKLYVNTYLRFLRKKLP